MTLNLYYSLSDKVFKLVNVDATDSPNSLDRNIDSWSHQKAENFNITFWKNEHQNEKNTHKYNRVGVHYTANGNRHRKYYFCVNDLIQLNELKLTDKL